MSEVGLDRLNQMSLPAALVALGRCCSSSTWCLKMVGARPFPSRAELLKFSDLKFSSLTRREWHEAFEHHPRIGDLSAIEKSEESAWSAQEQSSSLTASPDVLNELAEVNQKYEQRFGHVFIIFATGLETADILAEMRRRLKNDPLEEFAVAGEQHRRITSVRLEKLLDELGSDVTDPA